MSTALSIFWYRRDLRLQDNHGLYAALSAGRPVLPVFIFDPMILSRLEAGDQRVPFIYAALEALRAQLEPEGIPLEVCHAEPLAALAGLIARYPVAAVYANGDYEPYAKERDAAVASFLQQQGIAFHSFKDQVLFEKGEVVKDDGKPYLVYTPFYKKWRQRLLNEGIPAFPSESMLPYFYKGKGQGWPTLAEMGFSGNATALHVPVPSPGLLRAYHESRDLPAVAGTTRLGVHLRFGTVSVRQLAAQALLHSETFLKELCWREFFMQLLWHYPKTGNAFKPEYDAIAWRDDLEGFARWCAGTTGYPLVDAGMRELAATGFMHNRVRMVAASFLCKHLLIDWRWGEAWFAEKLMDFDLAANNGNWQWVAGCGCDAAPYFRVFNPELQAKRFDPHNEYIRRWVPEWGSADYPLPVVEHKSAVARCIKAYKKALGRDPQQELFP
ncbi:MAG: deoxyribodipyrimidine photo-lyase [Chitinophagaceae bacterium]|nr:MAG: deoxyribodipyrimidine photo-lyase [Chitinophagaceae bacterium]